MNDQLPMRIYLLSFFLTPLLPVFGQTTHLLVMDGTGFDPDTIHMIQGDSIHLVFDTTGHSMVQVPETSWMDEVPAPLIGIALGEGTTNWGLEHTFVIDSLVTIYYLCQQHPEEKGVLIVEEGMAIPQHTLPGIHLHPMPVSDVLYIEAPMAYTSLRFEDRQGRVVREVASNNGRGLDVSQMDAGLYFISLIDAHGSPLARERILIVR